MTNPELFTLLRWGLGICATGFLFLAGWIMKIQMMLKDKVDKTDIKEDLDTITASVKKIEEALVGTVDKKGLITELREQENKCDRNHP